MFHRLLASPLAEHFTGEELKVLAAVSESQECEKGDDVFLGRTKGQFLFFIEEGAVEVTVGQGSYVLRKKNWVGERAHLTRHEEQVKAIENVSGIFIDLSSLKHSKESHSLYLRLIHILAERMSHVLSRTEMVLQDTSQKQMLLLEMHDQVGKTLIHTVILMALWFNVNSLLRWFPVIRAEFTPFLDPAIIICIGLSVLYVIRSSPYSPAFYGLTFKKWGPHTVEAIMFTVPILVFLTLSKWVLIHYVPAFHGAPLFVRPPMDHAFYIASAVYIILVPVQELVVRGCLQSCLREFFSGSNRVWMAMITSNLFFEMFHIVVDIWLALSTFFLGLLWGALYEQQRSLVGPCVSHAIVGIWGFMILDYEFLFHFSRM